MIPAALVALVTAWLDRTFEGYHVPPLVAEFHKAPDVDAPRLEDGEQDAINLTVPPIPTLSNRVAQFTQVPRIRSIVDDSPLGTNPALMAHIAARRMPVVWEPPAAEPADDGPAPADSPTLTGDLHGAAIRRPGPGVSPSSRYQFSTLVGDTTILGV